MCEEHKAIIFGAGERGRLILESLGDELVFAFCDNYKFGKTFENKDIISFPMLKDIIHKNNKYDIVLSVDSAEMRDQLHNEDLPFYEFKEGDRCLFSNSYWKQKLDEHLYKKYRGLTNYYGKKIIRKNWFRHSCLSERNAMLKKAFMEGDNAKVSEILSKVYDNTVNPNEIYEDELYTNRPGMRLIAHIILLSGREKRVCDLACGHGEFLKNLRREGIACFGMDSSMKRCHALKNEGIECRNEDIGKCSYEDGIFDYVTMMECLEHVTRLWQ